MKEVTVACIATTGVLGNVAIQAYLRQDMLGARAAIAAMLITFALALHALWKLPTEK